MHRIFREKNLHLGEGAGRKLILTIHGEANTEHSSQLYVNCHVIICNQKNTQPRGAGYINLFGLG